MAKITRIAVKYKVPAAPYSLGTSEAANSRAVWSVIFYPKFSTAQSRRFSICSIRPAAHEYICLSRTTFSRFAADLSRFGPNVPPRSGLRPRLSSGSSVDGRNREVERKRSDLVMLLVTYREKDSTPRDSSIFPDKCWAVVYPLEIPTNVPQL